MGVIQHRTPMAMWRLFASRAESTGDKRNMSLVGYGPGSAQGSLLTHTFTLLELPWRISWTFFDRMQLRASCREATALQRKLEGMSGQIGGFGLAAALLSLAAMSGQFTFAEFVVAGHAWSWELLPRYLHFVITAITIVVRCACRVRKCLAYTGCLD